MVVNIGQDPVSLDPQFDLTTTALGVYANMFDFLIERDETGKFVPGIAESWRNVDDRTWEFKLRSGVMFHDGTPLTVEDVKFTYDRVLDPAMKSLRNPNINMVERGEVVDPTTFRLVTKEPYAALLSRVAALEILPKQAVTDLGNDKFALSPVGSGGYRFKEWVKDDHITLEANPSYWRGAPSIKTVTFKPVAENSTRVSNLKTAAADIVVNLPPHLATDVESDKSLRVERVHSLRNIFIGINTFAKPLDDKRVRQALNHAVDVDAIIKNVLGGSGYRTPGPIGENIFGYDPSIRPYAYDPDKAKALLAEAGLSSGFDLEFRSPNGRYVQDKEVAEAVAGYLGKVGIRPSLLVQEWGTFYADFLAKKYAGIYLFGVGNGFMDADGTLYLHMHSKGRGIYYNTPRTDELIAKGQTTVNEEERKKVYAETLRAIQDEAPWIFLFDQQDAYGVSAKLNWKPRQDERVILTQATLA